MRNLYLPSLKIGGARAPLAPPVPLLLLEQTPYGLFSTLNNNFHRNLIYFMKDDVRNLAQFTVMTENNFLKKISPWIWKKNVFWCSFNVDIFKCQLFDLLYIFYSLLWGMKTMEISITTHEIIWWKTLRSEATVNQVLNFLLFVCVEGNRAKGIQP